MACGTSGNIAAFDPCKTCHYPGWIAVGRIFWDITMCIYYTFHKRFNNEKITSQ